MMDVNCGWVQAVLSALVLVFVIWPTQILSATFSWWIVVVSAALLLWHAVSCKKCCGLMCSIGSDTSESDVKEKPKRKDK